MPLKPITVILNTYKMFRKFVVILQETRKFVAKLLRLECLGVIFTKVVNGLD